MSAHLRLRLALKAAAGARVVVAVDDLLLLLAELHDVTERPPAPADPAPVEVEDFDGFGMPVPSAGWDESRDRRGVPIDPQAPRPRVLQPPGPVVVPRGRAHVSPAATVEDAKLLARAAWDTCPERVQGHGKFDDAEPGITWSTVQAALAAIGAMVEARR